MNVLLSHFQIASAFLVLYVGAVQYGYSVPESQILGLEYLYNSTAGSMGIGHGASR